MSRNVIVGADECVICPSCQHPFPLEQGISGQTIDRYAEDFERTLAAEAGRRAEKESARQLAAVKAQLAESARALEESRAQIEKVREDSARAAREAQQTELKSLEE